MRVRLELWGNLRRFAPEGVASLDLDVPESATVADLVGRIGAGADVFAAAVNGTVAAFTTRLSPNDRVVLFDHFKGG